MCESAFFCKKREITAKIKQNKFFSQLKSNSNFCRNWYFNKYPDKKSINCQIGPNSDKAQHKIEQCERISTFEFNHSCAENLKNPQNWKIVLFYEILKKSWKKLRIEK